MGNVNKLLVIESLEREGSSQCHTAVVGVVIVIVSKWRGNIVLTTSIMSPFVAVLDADWLSGLRMRGVSPRTPGLLVPSPANDQNKITLQLIHTHTHT